ncbi:MAG TPA: insulinase family protein, partial [Halanaerobiales bacterium]|nr:insulinase family protein [Halanaerobiales bacterium]
MYQDSPNWQSFYQLLQSLFYKYPIKNNIAGTQKSIEKINKKTLIDFFDKFYSLDNMTLIVIGAINSDRLFDWLDKNITIKRNQDFSYEKLYPEEPMGIRLEEKDLAMSISRPIISLGYKENSRFENKEKIIKQDMLTNMILEMIFGKSSDNYHDLYNKDLIDENFSFNYMREKNSGFAKIYAETNSIDRTINGITEIIDNWEQEIDNENFEVVKHKFIGRYFRSLNSVETLSSQIIKYLKFEQNYLDIIKMIKDIKLDEVIKQYKNLLQEKEHVKIIIRKVHK